MTTRHASVSTAAPWPPHYGAVTAAGTICAMLVDYSTGPMEYTDHHRGHTKRLQIIGVKVLPVPTVKHRPQHSGGVTTMENLCATHVDYTSSCIM